MSLFLFKKFVESHTLFCINCYTRLPKEVKTYPHSSGLVNKNGKKYWAYIECSKCHYQNAFWKLLPQIKRTTYIKFKRID